MVLVHRERGSGAGKGKETEVDGDTRPVFQEKEKQEAPMLGWMGNGFLSWPLGFSLDSAVPSTTPGHHSALGP